MLEYLWNIEGINWGFKNLEFALNTATLVNNEQIMRVLLLGNGFGRLLRSLEFENAMDLLEDYVMSDKARLSENLQMEVFSSSALVPYNFIGTLLDGNF